jgi:hypothetical protein
LEKPETLCLSKGCSGNEGTAEYSSLGKTSKTSSSQKTKNPTKKKLRHKSNLCASTPKENYTTTLIATAISAGDTKTMVKVAVHPASGHIPRKFNSSIAQKIVESNLFNEMSLSVDQHLLIHPLSQLLSLLQPIIVVLLRRN